MEHHPGDAVAWFRPEERRKVPWDGDPSKLAVPHPQGARLAPHDSFAARTEPQRGRSAPWTAADVQTAEDLRQAMTGALLHQAERQLAHLSAYDSLTGMANRRTVEARLKRWSLDGAPPCATLLFIDLDRFKAINDTLGHQAGDECLIEVAARLLRLAPPGSLAGRLGGDEFVLFWPGAARPAAQALADALVLELDRSFVAPLGSSAKSDRLFTAIVDMARTLNMRTVAEGCETWEQWRTLQTAGCEFMQGWLAAPALDAPGAERLLRSAAQVCQPPATIRLLADDLWRTTDADRPGLPGRMIIQKDGLLGGDIFLAAVQLTRIAMTVVDPRQPDMPVVFANRAFEVMTGYDKSQILGRNCRFLQGPETDAAAIRQIQQALAALQPVTVELINYRADRSTFLNALQISPVFDGSGQLVFFVGSQLDISWRRWI
jgi:diguanylate cyclase (GGDEF)-like protein/PAS domain S-box-containing protein